MKICVIGTGYVGLVTGTCFAEAGNDVICVDVDKAKIESLSKGLVPIFEPGLETLVHSNTKEGRLVFTTDLALAINQSNLSFIAVGTPPTEDGSADLRHVLDVAETIAKVTQKKVIVGTKSTVPVGTGDKIEALFKEKMKHPFVVFSNPEFLKEGDAVNDFMKPDRVIVGMNEDGITELIGELYAPFTRQRERLILMTRRSAELTKYAANAMLATRISFMNEMANLCEKVGAHVGDIRQGIGSDSRIGPAFLFPSIGYGGSCFPKDVKALLKMGLESDVALRVVEAASLANQKQKDVLFSKMVAHYGGPEKLKGLKLALWGLAFKAKTDDVRESPALGLLDRLLSAGCAITAYDPQASKNVEKIYGNKIQYQKNSYDCLEGTHGLVIATEWNEFRSPDFVRMKKLLKQPVIFDGRNILNAPHVKKLGFTYYGIGV